MMDIISSLKLLSNILDRNFHFVLDIGQLLISAILPVH